MKQTYNNIEIIFINDGSSDNSGKILEEYAKKDGRIKVIHQEKLGVSRARNSGLLSLRGEFFGFIDADDYIEKNMYECLYTSIIENHADMATCGYSMTFIDSDISATNKKKVPEYTMSTKKFMKYIYIRDTYKGVGGSVCTRLFRTNTFKHIFFDEDIINCEDALYLARCCISCKTMVYNSKILYHYVQRKNSAWHNYAQRVHSMSALDAYERIIKLFENSLGEFIIILYTKRFYVYHASILLEISYNEGWDENIKEIKKRIKKYFMYYIITNLQYPKRIVNLVKLINKSDSNK